MTLEKLLKNLRANFDCRIDAIEFHDHVWFYNLHVPLKFRNQGVGTAVVTALKKWSSKRDLPLACMPENLDLVNWYQGLGFEFEHGKQCVFRPKLLEINKNVATIVATEIR